jgi:hypothetical protein
MSHGRGWPRQTAAAWLLSLDHEAACPSPCSDTSREFPDGGDERTVGLATDFAIWFAKSLPRRAASNVSLRLLRAEEARRV